MEGVIKRLLALHPEHSNRAIAAAIGVSPMTVGAVRESAPTVQFGQLERRVGLDGKSRPATRTAVTTAAASLITKTDLDARRLCRSLRVDP